MRVKIFRGPSTQKVLQDIKKSFGDKAIILSTKTVKEKNLTLAEVMIAVEEENVNTNLSPSYPIGSTRGIALWDRWQNEWREFKRELFSIFKSHVELNHIPKKYRLFLDLLEKEGVLPEIIFHLYKKIRENSQISIKELLDFVKKDPLLSKNMGKNYKFNLVTGPAGVGKTTTLLKMVLNYRQNNSEEKICIVNGDVNNIKKLFLKYYTDLYSLDYKEIKESYDWLKLISERKLFDKIFIDLPSLKKGETLLQWWKDNGLDALDESCIYLVLSPVYSYPQIEIFLKKYYHHKIQGIIWTKLDEARRYGGIINTCFYSDIPISLFSYGPQLKNSLISPSDKVILELVLKHKLPK